MLSLQYEPVALCFILCTCGEKFSPSSWKCRNCMYLLISWFLLINLPVPGFHAVYSSLQPFLCPAFFMSLPSFSFVSWQIKSSFQQREKPTGGKKTLNVSFANPHTASQPFVCLLCLDSKLFRGGALFLCLYKCLADWGPDIAEFLRGYRNAQ